MRSFDKKMPEEVNRITTDHIASLNLCSTDIAVENVTVIKELDYNDTHDTAEIDINITVPENEPPGNKVVTIYIIGEQA
jgi:hypothetical protein